MKIILRDLEERMQMQMYANKIGMPMARWYEDTWVSAFSVVKGITKQEALAELQRRSDNYNPCECERI